MQVWDNSCSTKDNFSLSFKLDYAKYMWPVIHDVGVQNYGIYHA